MWLASRLRLRTGTLLHPALFVVDLLIFLILFQAIVGDGQHYFSTPSQCVLRSTYGNMAHVLSDSE